MKNKILDIKKDWKFILIFVSVVTIFLILTSYIINISDTKYTKVEKLESEDCIENITDGTEISQTFFAKYENLQKVYIDFEPFKSESNVGGIAIIGIKDENGNLIKEVEIQRNHIRENSTYKFEFPIQKDSQNKSYELYIKFKDLGEKNKFYSVKFSKDNIQEGSNLKVNNAEVNGNIVIEQLYKSNTRTTVYLIAQIIIVLYVSITSFYIYKKKDLKEEKVFLFTIPVICLLFMIVMPTFKNHDELYHWIRTYEVSEGIFTTKLENGIQGSELPSGILSIMPNDWTTLKYKDLKESINEKLEPKNTTIIDSSTAAVYSCIQYIPQAIGTFIARIFTDNTLILTYAARITNIIFAMTLIYFAIKLMPFGKKIFLLLSYIPIAIEGFSSLSPDAMIISVAFLYVAYILNISFKEGAMVTNKRKIFLCILSIIIALCKIVYLPLILLLLIIPKEKFVINNKTKKNASVAMAKKRIFDKNNQKKFITVMIIAIISIGLNLAWLAYSSRYLQNFREGDSSYQVLNVLTHPFRYLAEFIYTIDLNGTFYINGMFGEGLGWGELIRLNFIVPFILFILVIVEIFLDNTLRNKFKTYQKIIIGFTFLIIVGLIFTSLYVQWTTIGSTSILGVQGRYFIPILPLLILLIGDVLKINSQYSESVQTKLISITGLLTFIIVFLKIIIAHL